MFRLGHQVSPTHYSVNLTVTPGQPTFQGVIDIDLKFTNPTTQFWMNATALQISRAELRTGNTAEPAKVELRDDRLAGISFDHEIPAGDGQLHIEYSGKVSSNSSAGVFQLEEDGRWYLYTQFEPTDARRAFPCFDEPSFKVPWQVTLNVPKDQKAFSNTPSLSEKGQTGGRKIVKFADTRPLPSYLVAFAVGPFDVVDAGAAGAKHTKIRILTPQGKAANAKYAAAAIPDLLVLLEKYFAIPFPYEKLDSVAMPISNFAMENAGLITYGEQTLLGDPDDDTLTRQRSFAIVAAHEMAHQWFGDLVTTAWWDDIWLNEGFATWMETKIVNEWKPDWHTNVDAVDDSQEAMGLDSLVSARKIRQPIVSESDIANAFDNITYMKGAAVLRMFENYIGPEVFRHGVQAYIKAHADKNATTDDFLAAIGAANGRNVAPSFGTFLDQPGVPEVSATLRCINNQAALELTQKRYLPLGSPGRKNSDSELWQIPVCARYAGSSECVLLTKHADEVHLASKDGCPAWLIPNAGANGYYHATVDLKTAAKELTLAELVGSLGDVKALVESGGEKASDALTIVPGFAANPERRVVDADTDIASLTESTFMPGDIWPRAAALVDHVFGPKARELGWEPRPTDGDEVRLLRHHLVRFAANAGEDTELVHKASELTKLWLKDHKAVNAGEVADVLEVAAAHGGRDLFDQLRAAAAATHDHRQRQAAINALGSFRDPAIAKDAIALLLTDEFDAREAYFALLFGPLDYPATRSLPFDFLKGHVDDLLKKLPREVGEDFAADLPRVGEAFCDATKRDEIEAFFKDRVKGYVGGPRTLEQTIEKIDVCIGERRAIEPEIDRFLMDAVAGAR